MPSLNRRFPRRGTVVPFLLVSLSLFLATFALAVNKYWYWSVHEEIKTAADAAALAATAILADDDFLRGNPQLYPDVLIRSAHTAIAMGEPNLVRGRPLMIVDNPTNDAAGDIVIGSLTMPRSADFAPVPSRESSSADQARANTVLVAGRLTRKRGNGLGLIFGVFAGLPYVDVQAVSAATLDRGVRGFQPFYQPVPLAPIALLSSALNPQSWESLVENGTGPDNVAFNREAQSFGPGPDQIHEFEAVYAADQNQLAAANTSLVFLPNADASNLIRQIGSGLIPSDMQTYQGKFLLPDVGTKDLPGKQFGPPDNTLVVDDVANALALLRDSGAPRIWPLYTGFDVGTSTVQISGFVAARVVSVVAPVSGQPLRFTLQATVMITPTALTDTDLHGGAATRNDNRYVCKLRRIE